MTLIELRTDIVTSQWDKIAEHSDTEKAALITVLDYTLQSYFDPQFKQLLPLYIDNLWADLEEKSVQFEMNLPLTSIRHTLDSLHKSILAVKSLPLFLKVTRPAILQHTRFVYRGSILKEDVAVCIPEANLKFNVKCDLVGNKIIESVSFCYKKKLATFACAD